MEDKKENEQAKPEWIFPDSGNHSITYVRLFHRPFYPVVVLNLPYVNISII